MVQNFENNVELVECFMIIIRYARLLNLLFLMFRFDSPENIKIPNIFYPLIGFRIFSGGSIGNMASKKIK